MVLLISGKYGKNGKFKLKLLLDTNVIIDFLKNENDVINLSSLLFEHECFTSVIVKLELLKFSGITPDEENIIYELFKFIPVMQLNQSIENETIAISRAAKLKLPDAIIGATAIVYDAEIVTKDAHFMESKYKKLKIWENFTGS